MSLTVLKHKLIGSSDEGLPTGFRCKKQLVSGFVEPLELCKASIEKWISVVQNIHDAALYFQNNLPGDMHFSERNLHGETEDKDILFALKKAAASVASKQKLIESVLKESEDVTLAYNLKLRATRKLEEAPKRIGGNIQKASEELSEATWKFNEQYSQSLASFEFILSKSGERGGYGLVIEEMRLLQFTQTLLFKNCGKITSDALQNDDSFNCVTALSSINDNPFESFMQEKERFIALNRVKCIESSLSAEGVKRVSGASRGDMGFVGSSSGSSYSSMSTNSSNSIPPPPPPPTEKTNPLRPPAPLPPGVIETVSDPKKSEAPEEVSPPVDKSIEKKILSRVSRAFEVGHSGEIRAFVDRIDGTSFWVDFGTLTIYDKDPSLP